MPYAALMLSPTTSIVAGILLAKTIELLIHKIMNTKERNMQILSESVISVNNLTKQVPALDSSSGNMLDILKGVNLEIKSADTIAIIGASGSGKST